MAFRDRTEAGQVLAEKLPHYQGRDDLVVLALPRGGVPVAFEVAKALQAPLDVFLVRKLGLPGHEELAMGAIASGGTLVLNRDVVQSCDVPLHVIEAVASQERRELERRERAYRDDRPPAVIAGRAVIVVDDGLATGATMRAAAEAIRQRQPSRLVIAVPVSAVSTCEEIREQVDEVICAITPPEFFAVGMWYHDFSPTTDLDVKNFLEAATHWVKQPASPTD